MEIVTTEHIIRILEVELQGRVDAFSVPALREHLQQLLDNQAINFVIDLSAVSFMDSAGMASLVSILKRSRQAGGDVYLVWPQKEAARRILHLTKFDRVFDIMDTREEAIQKFGG